MGNDKEDILQLTSNFYLGYVCSFESDVILVKIHN